MWGQTISGRDGACRRADWTAEDTSCVEELVAAEGLLATQAGVNTGGATVYGWRGRPQDTQRSFPRVAVVADNEEVVVVLLSRGMGERVTVLS